MTTNTDDSRQILQELAEAGVTPSDQATKGPKESPSGEGKIGPGETVIRGPDLDFPLGITSNLAEAGYTTVFYADKSSPRYGEPSTVNLNMLPSQLQKRVPGTGQRAFTTTDPGVRPKQGTLKCWLHKDHSMRDVCDSFGFVFCNKQNITSEYEVTEHVRRRHSREFAAMEDKRRRAEYEEERDARAIMMAAWTTSGQGDAGPRYSSGECPYCKFVSEARSPIYRDMSVREHSKTKHPSEGI